MAKVTRDRLVAAAAADFPAYMFENSKGIRPAAPHCLSRVWAVRYSSEKLVIHG